MKDMGDINKISGEPTLKLEGGALARLQSITPEGHRASIHLTLTDDYPMAMAVVVIEALPFA
jgi:holo-[acyl-carrier protein] synthase